MDAAQPEQEGVAELAAQWRNARAVAEAQDRRRESLEIAAEKLCPMTELEGTVADLAWCDRAEEVARQLGLTALEETADCAWRLVDQLGERLLAATPNDVQEAALKFGVLVTMLQANNYEVDEPGRLHGFLDDLTRLAARRAA
jgi:hypothetical protein